MKNTIELANIVQFKSMHKQVSLQDAIKESNRCLLCFDAPCSAGCPAGTNPAKFIRQIKFHNYKGAARTIRENNILGSVCAYVCPVENLCEKACSVKALDEPININGLQRFAIEYGEQNGIEAFDKSKNCNGKVAIIGCGPSGMGCASVLAKMDCDVTIFEKEAVAGGVPQWNIPEFRLPKEAIEHDVNNLLSQGVKINFNAAIEGNETVINLLKNGFDAVFVSTGLSKAFILDLFKDYPNALDYISFLRKIKINKGNIDLENKTVAVIGGGSVAVDSAVSAKACGAKKVYLISLEHLSELPADKEEINLAHSMNIIFKPGCQIKNVLVKEGKIYGLQGIEIEWKELNKFTPDNVCPIEGTDFSINTDLVVLAIGTKPGEEVANFANGIHTKGKGVLVVNENFETNISGIFAGGDVVNGGATVVQAVGEGKKAAEGIINYLKNRRNSL